LTGAGRILYLLGHVTKKKVSAAVDGRFLDAAARLFKQQGFAATTVRQIAKAAGMLPGSLHYRYPTKDSLLLALMRRGVEADMACIREAISASRDPMERLRLALRARVRFLLARDSASVILFDWRSLKGPAHDEMIRQRDAYEAFWIGLINEAAGAGRLRPGLDLKLLRLLVFGAVNWVALWYSPRGERSPEEIADAFWGFIAFGVFDDAHRPADVESALRELSALEPWGPRRLQGGLREGRK
jgi:TetR/AcrR family transcriptional regulator, cholesterol catabolism regulator